MQNLGNVIFTIVFVLLCMAAGFVFLRDIGVIKTVSPKTEETNDEVVQVNEEDY